MSRLQISRTLADAFNFVGGARVKPAQASHHLTVYEPATGTALCHCGVSSPEDVDATVSVAKSAFPSWSRLSGFERGKFLLTAAQLIRENVDDIAYWEVRDNGKPVYEARMDIAGCADTFAYFGGVAGTLAGEHIALSGGERFAFTRREPLGVCAGIGAWNYPFQTASWKIAPALACGNTFIYKPSPLTPVTAVILAEILNEAGLPSGAINILQGEAATGQALCLHPDVRKISFTGSVPTGQIIMQMCATRGLKPVTLELGGKSPLIIFPDANLDNAVVGAMMANFFTQGEVCSNAARVFVHRSLLDEFTEKLLEKTKALKIGDPMLESTRVGASISEQHVEKVLGYIDSARKEGATVLFGGERVSPTDTNCQDGFFLSPCIIGDVTDQMTVAKEEIFGAVLLILPFDSEEEVLQRANDSEFGLSAGIFTDNLQRAHRVAAELQAGNVYINSYNDVSVEVPFGGYKMSGIGRENGLAALHHYSQLKAIFVNNAKKLESPFD